MERLTLDWIREQCDTAVVFSRGMEYFKGGLVKNLTFDKKEQIYNARVKGTKMYDVDIIFYDENSDDVYEGYYEAYCSCPAYSSMYNICKHIVAVFLSIYQEQREINSGIAISSAQRDAAPKQAAEEKQKKEEVEKMRQFKQAQLIAVQNMLGLAEQPKETQKNMGLDANKILLRPTLTIAQHSWEKYWEHRLSMKMGLSQLYVVKNMEEFLDIQDNGGALTFGKKLTYSTKEHWFDEQDKQLIDFLLELNSLNSSLRQRAGYMYDNRQRLFNGKNAIIPYSMVKRLLDILKNRCFDFELNGKVYPISSIKKDFPIKMNLSREEHGLKLETNIKGNVIAIDPEKNYLFYKSEIYAISSEQKHGLLSVLAGLAHMNPIIIPPQYQEEFATQLYPLLGQVGKVKLTEEVAKAFIQEPLKVKIYLDEEGKKLLARVLFCYGEREIDPFSKAQINSQQQESFSSSLLIRDSQKESFIMDQLEQANFEVGTGGLHLKDEEYIYSFIVLQLPKLQEQAEIYYSERLKNLSVQRPKVKGRLGLTPKGDLLEIGLQWEGIDHAELTGLFKALREKRRYYRLKNGGFFSLTEDQELQELATVLDELAIKDKDLKKPVLHLPKYRAFNLDQALQSNLGSNFVKETAFQALIDRVKNPNAEPVIIPEAMDKLMREYQKQGFHWLKTLAKCGFGGILADDMGLGKTLQAIALIDSELQEKGGVALVVAPTSVVYNWQAELAKFAPHLTSIILAGTRVERQSIMAQWPDMPAKVLITSYALLRRDEELYQDKVFSLLILDEAQYIKNAHSQTAIVSKSIVASQTFALTGTPVENSLAELWSIFDFILPGYLHSFQEFAKRYGKPIQQDGDKKAAKTLAKRISPFILRRLKKDVLKELPDKIEDKLLSPLTEDQEKIYLAYWNQFRGQVRQELEEQGFEKAKLKILTGIMRLRQICCHPGLFLEDYQGGSGKLEQLAEVVEDSLASGHRILIFSQFTGMLELISKMLTLSNKSYFYLDGATPAAKRLEMAASFNSGERQVFLVSLKAGGTGLNLIGADKVIHFDLWWNPAVEDQASDRAHRIGQSRIVHVTRMISMGTIEEKIYALQQQKRELIDQVIKPEETLLTSLSEKEIRQLLEL